MNPAQRISRRTTAAIGLVATIATLGPLSWGALAHESSGHRQPPWQQATEWPDRIVVTLSGDPNTGFAVSWRTDTSVPNALAQIAPATSDARFDLAAETLSAKTTVVTLHEVERPGGNEPIQRNRGLPEVFYHSVRFEGLQPDRFYAYRVRGAAGKFSPWRQVRTAPTDGPVTFLFFGDAQRGIRSHTTRVFDMGTRIAPTAHFALHAGDLVNTAMYDREWAEWFEAIGNLHRVTPIVPVAGNHDYMNFGGTKLFASTDKRVSPLWRPQFALPAAEGLPKDLQGTVYDLRYTDDVHLFVLDSSGIAFDEQIEWLRGKLKETTARWRVLTMHHPLFSFVGGREHPSHRQRRLALVGLLEEADIDLVLCGHRHTYQRGEYGDDVARFAVGDPHEVRTVFMVTASCASRGETKVAGWDRYTQETDGAFTLTRYADNTPLFATITIDGDELSCTTYDATGETYDAFRIDKPDGQPKTIEDGSEAKGLVKTYDNTGRYRDWNDLRQ